MGGLRDALNGAANAGAATAANRIATLADCGGGGGAPTTADYLVKTANAGLSAERVVTDGTTITADWSAAGLVKLNFVPSASVGFLQQQATQFLIENRTSDPASPAAGEIWLRTDL